MMRKDFEPGPLSKVESHASGSRSTLVFVRDLRHPPDRIWAALTDPAQLREWAPFTTEGSLASLGATTLKMMDGQKAEEFPAQVLRAEPPVLLEYTWGDDLLTWELAPSGTGTRLTLRHTVESGDWMPKVAAGWHICLVVAERLIDGEPIGPIVGEEAKQYGWERLHQAYAEELGIVGSGWPKEKF